MRGVGEFLSYAEQAAHYFERPHQAPAAQPLRTPAAWRGRDVASSCLLASTALLPLGFLLGGVVIHAGDPGLGIVLLPVGAILLLVALSLVVRGVWAR